MNTVSAPWLSIIGIGDDGLDGLSPIARSALDAAEVIFGGERHRAMLGDDGREIHGWSSPFRDSIDRILSYRGRQVAVLATGDPLWFGAGTTLLRIIPVQNVRIFPSPSAFSLAAARMGWSLPDAECLTAHGQAVETIIPFITPSARLLILCRDGDTPGEIATLLRDRGFGDSPMTAMSHMAGAQETSCEGTAADWNSGTLSALTTVAVDCVASADALLLSPAPGLPDEAFAHDGMLTKREVRAATLAALVPLPGQTLWDVGAGCGSVAIEWCRAARHAKAVAIESDEKRLAFIRTNAMTLGAPRLKIVDRRAPDALTDLPPPNAVFIGGGLTTGGLVEACWEALSPSGRLVANAVTIEGENRLIAAQDRYGGELVRIAISRAVSIGTMHGWRPMMPVTQWRAHKK
jgi:precorrin-6Y C5,15-methyltransferase (decarboxylating)